MQKFELLVDLGLINVPGNYKHEIQLIAFRDEYRSLFRSYSDNVTYGNFPNPTRILKRGDVIRARVFKQSVPSTTTSEERMAFLATQNAIYTGAQGASLVFEQLRDQLPKDMWYTSYDEEGRLWLSEGYRKVPRIFCYPAGDFAFDLGEFEIDCDNDVAFLCFSDE